MDSKLKCDLSDAKDMASEGLPEYVITQAGCWPSEDNDCGIVAVSIVTDLPYRLIHKLAKVCVGRNNRECLLNMKVGHRFWPFKFHRVNKKSFKLGTILNRYPQGRYYVQIGGASKGMGRFTELNCHALAVIDGKIYDRHINPPDRWVKDVFKIEGLKPKSWWGWKELGLKNNNR
jgi:hypothetical protein